MLKFIFIIGGSMKQQWSVWALAVASMGGLVVTFGGCSTTTNSSPVADVLTTDDTASTDDTGEKKTSSKKKDAVASCEAKLDGACGTCMKKECCDALVECEGDKDCAACVSGEDPDGCERTTATHERVNLYLACKGGDCKDDCIGVSGGSCKGLLTGIVAEACITCMEASCCDQVSACKAEAGCWSGCFTDRDVDKCHNDVNGHAVYHAMTECVAKSCSDACK